jgi:ribosomal protein L29
MYKDFISLDKKQLANILLRFKKKLFNCRIQKASNNLTNTSVVSQIKKDVQN